MELAHLPVYFTPSASWSSWLNKDRGQGGEKNWDRNASHQSQWTAHSQTAEPFFFLVSGLRNEYGGCRIIGKKEVIATPYYTFFCVQCTRVSAHTHTCTHNVNWEKQSLKKSKQINRPALLLNTSILHSPTYCLYFYALILCFNSYLHLFTQLNKRFNRGKLHHSSFSKICSGKGCI